MTGQLTLWDTVEVRPTSAMTAGEQRVDQCAWCGTIVVSPTGHQPHGCPCCDQHGEADPTWWAQSLPVAGIHHRDEPRFAVRGDGPGHAPWQVIDTGRPPAPPNWDAHHPDGRLSTVRSTRGEAEDYAAKMNEALT